MGEPVSRALAILFAGIAVITFTWPLWGIHRRLVEEKKRLMQESSSRFESAVAQLHRRVDTQRRRATPRKLRRDDLPAAPVFVPPSPPSWFDRLTDWVGRLPGPFWAFYLGLALVIYLLETVVQWQSGTTPFGSFLPTHTAMALSAIALGLGHYLKGYAGRAFDTYRPSLRADAAEGGVIGYRLP